MQQRSPATVVLLSLVTFGVYFLIWMIKTKDEMNAAHRAEIPTAWLCWVPLWWAWKYARGVELATRGKVSQVGAMLWLHLLPVVGQWVIQAKINETLDERVGALATA